MRENKCVYCQLINNVFAIPMPAALVLARTRRRTGDIVVKGTCGKCKQSTRSDYPNAPDRRTLLVSEIRTHRLSGQFALTPLTDRDIQCRPRPNSRVTRGHLGSVDGQPCVHVEFEAAVRVHVLPDHKGSRAPRSAASGRGDLWRLAFLTTAAAPTPAAA